MYEAERQERQGRKTLRCIIIIDVRRYVRDGEDKNKPDLLNPMVLQKNDEGDVDQTNSQNYRSGEDRRLSTRRVASLCPFPSRQSGRFCGWLLQSQDCMAGCVGLVRFALLTARRVYELE